MATHRLRTIGLLFCLLSYFGLLDRVLLFGSGSLECAVDWVDFCWNYRCALHRWTPTGTVPSEHPNIPESCLYMTIKISFLCVSDTLEMVELPFKIPVLFTGLKFELQK